MPDNREIAEGTDRKRISLQQEHEVRYWTKRFNVTKEELTRAVESAGNGVDAVERYLTQRKH